MQLTENTRQAFPVIYGIASWREPYLELLGDIIYECGATPKAAGPPRVRFLSFFWRGQPLSEAEGYAPTLSPTHRCIHHRVSCDLPFRRFGHSCLPSAAELQGQPAANVDALNARHEALEKELTQLKENRETTIALARGLGLYLPGDRIVQLEGRTGRSEVYAMGDLLHMTESDGSRSQVFKLAACIVALLLILAVVILARAPAGGRLVVTAGSPGSLQRLIRVLEAGGVAIAPGDTMYGLIGVAPPPGNASAASRAGARTSPSSCSLPILRGSPVSQTSICRRRLPGTGRVP